MPKRTEGKLRCSSVGLRIVEAIFSGGDLRPEDSVLLRNVMPRLWLCKRAGSAPDSLCHPALLAHYQVPMLRQQRSEL